MTISLFLVLFLFNYLLIIDSLTQDILNKLLNNPEIIGDLTKEWVTPLRKLSTESSSVETACNRFPVDSKERKRTVCYTSSETRILRNVKMQDNGLTLFNVSLDERTKDPALHPIASKKPQQTVHFTMKLQYDNRIFDRLRFCKSFYNGTLHIVGKFTTHNVYHASMIICLLLVHVVVSLLLFS
jgi:hypothetical protein